MNKNSKRTSRLSLSNTKAVQPQGIVDQLDSFSEAAPITTNAIPLAKIKLPDAQPRKYFDPKKLKQLVESIRKDGILQPLLVRPKGDNYELVAGERRYRAAKEIGLSEVPVNVREMSDDDARRYALVENLQREDLNPVEETQAILDLLAVSLKKNTKGVISLLRRMQDEEAGKSPHNVMRGEEAQVVIGIFQGLGKMTWESFVKNRLGILNLPKDVLDAVQSGEIEYTKGKVIAQIKDEDARWELLNDAIEEDLSLSAIREEVRKLKAPDDDDLSDVQAILQAWTNACQVMIDKNSLADTKIRRKVDKLLSQVEKLLGIDPE
ncbi:MAG TPA: ParB/RepB/Spo0J family partition protein [Stenomitos sp.]